MNAAITLPETGTDHLLVEQPQPGILLVTLNRPKARNAVSFEMWQGFGRLLDAVETGSPARAIILQGAGNFFSAGGDLRIAPASGEGALSLATRLEWGQRSIARLRRLPIPVIAAVETAAFGVGWSLALACDMIFAADDARFAAPFVDVGLAPDGGATWFLGQQLGRYRAAELFFSGRVVDVAEAHALGLISRIVPAGMVADAAVDFAASIGKGNRHATELTKRLIHAAQVSDLEASHALELAYCHILQSGDELARAKAAFAANAAARAAKP